MQRVPLGRSVRDPRFVSNFLDTCAFDPKYTPEDQAAQQIRALNRDDQITLALTHSNQKEIDHPNTPEDVKREAKGMIYTIDTSLTPDEISRKENIHAILTGNGKPEKYAADSEHVFIAGKYVGYFITTDQRILNKRIELGQLTSAIICTPSEWLKVFHDTEHA